MAAPPNLSESHPVDGKRVLDRVRAPAGVLLRGV
jgi:hypothetical protein